MVKPGVVVEECFTAYDKDVEPALEFKFLFILGCVYVANRQHGGWHGEWWPGVVNQNGTMVKGSGIKTIPEWVNWPHLVVDVAECLGAHKDMFHVDLFVGVPAGSPALWKKASQSERKAVVQHMVSEVSLASSEPLPAEILEEATCL